MLIATPIGGFATMSGSAWTFVIAIGAVMLLLGLGAMRAAMAAAAGPATVTSQA